MPEETTAAITPTFPSEPKAVAGCEIYVFESDSFAPLDEAIIVAKRRDKTEAVRLALKRDSDLRAAVLCLLDRLGESSHEPDELSEDTIRSLQGIAPKHFELEGEVKE